MSTSIQNYMEAIERLPDGATLVIHQFSWDDYERLLKDLVDRPHLRFMYDRGKLEIMSPLPEHEEYASFIDDLVRVFADRFNLKLEKRGRATWKRRDLARGLESDCSYYVASADRIIGKRKIDLEIDPPPDIAVEIDITNESLSKFHIYAALGVPEIWRYDSKEIRFYALTSDTYREIIESHSLPGLKPSVLTDALEQSKTDGQTAALGLFRQQLV